MSKAKFTIEELRKKLKSDGSAPNFGARQAEYIFDYIDEVDSTMKMILDKFQEISNGMNHDGNKKKICQVCGICDDDDGFSMEGYDCRDALLAWSLGCTREEVKRISQTV